MSCASKFGGNVKIKADQLHYPISFTPYIHNKNNTVVYYKNETDKNGLVKVGEFNYTYYGKVPKRGLEGYLTLQISDIINKEIKKVNGDGIVNFKILDVDSYPINFSSTFPHFYYQTFALMSGFFMFLFSKNSPEEQAFLSPTTLRLVFGASSAMLIAYYLKLLPSNVKVKIKGDIVKFVNK